LHVWHVNTAVEVVNDSSVVLYLFVAAITVAVVQVGCPVCALVLLDAARRIERSLHRIEGRSRVDVYVSSAYASFAERHGLTVRAGNGVTMTQDTIRIHNGIDSTRCDGTADHTPDGIDMANSQAEDDDQKGARDALRLDCVRRVPT
jgi:hypothetical protein